MSSSGVKSPLLSGDFDWQDSLLNGGYLKLVTEFIVVGLFRHVKRWLIS